MKLSLIPFTKLQNSYKFNPQLKYKSKYINNNIR